MAFFSQETGLAEGIRRTVQTGILLASATPGPLLAALMDGEEKALVIHYFGPEDGSTYDPNRMDGEVTLIRPGDEGEAVRHLGGYPRVGPGTGSTTTEGQGKTSHGRQAQLSLGSLGGKVGEGSAVGCFNSFWEIALAYVQKLLKHR